MMFGSVVIKTDRNKDADAYLAALQSTVMSVFLTDCLFQTPSLHNNADTFLESFLGNWVSKQQSDTQQKILANSDTSTTAG